MLRPHPESLTQKATEGISGQFCVTVILSPISFPHPEEPRSGVSKDGHGLRASQLMVRDGAGAPPHHEGWSMDRIFSQALRSRVAASRRMVTELQHLMVRDGASRLLTMRSQCFARQLSITHPRASRFGTVTAAAIANKFPQIYVQLSFLAYYSNCPCLDTEWLLSTLFDASLLSTSKPPATAALFLRHASCAI